MRTIKYLVIHTTASPQTWNWQKLQHFFLNSLKWKREGYHVTIQPDGVVKRYIDNTKPSNGVQAYKNETIDISNSNSINISYIGGITAKGQPIDNRTDIQKEKMKEIIEWYLKEYPEIIILGHNQIAAKACPCFSVPKYLQELGVPKKNIYDKDNFTILKHNKY
jgi:N-acetylmuramoyl-L-alanine amidase